MAGAHLSSANYELPPTDVTVSYRIAGREGTVYEWKGKLSRYEGLGLDAQSRTVPVRIQVDNPSEVYVNGQRLADASDAGLPALVRGMFVQCRIHTVPPKNIMLVPKLALKPGNQLWKFEPDDSLVAPEDSGSNSEEMIVEPAASTLSQKNAPININPDEWRAGRLIVTTGVNVVNLVNIGPSGKEYWVVQGSDQLHPNDLVVVSPLANLAGDGSDQVRYQIEKSADVTLAGKKD
jgi:multidrug efflux pump subunit AcrA (membrane-fusion protein)